MHTKVPLHVNKPKRTLKANINCFLKGNSLNVNLNRS